ncbi:MAG: efflux RND transporter permease subunit [Planctomycetaceae bacterium]
MKSEQQSHLANGPFRMAAATTALRWPLAIAGVIILAVALPLSLRLRMDRTIDQMFGKNDPTLLAYDELRDAFGGNAAMMLVYRDNELMTAQGLARASDLSARIAELPTVRGVLSVAQLNELLGVIRPGGLLTGLSSATPPLLRKDDIIAKAFERLFVGYTHSESGDESAIVVLLEPADQTTGYQGVVGELRTIAEDLPEEIDDAVLVGEPVLLSEGFDLIERDGARLAVWTIALLSPLVLLLLRRIRWVVLQGVVIAWAVTVTRATLYLAGIRLSLVSSILTAICTVIAVTAVIHLGSRWQTRISRQDQRQWATMRTLCLVMPVIFWACATDAAGFISLLGSAIAPIRDFAVMMAVASIAVWAAIALLGPLVMTLGFNDRVALFEPLLARLERAISRGAVRTAALMICHRWSVVFGSLLLTAATVVGISRLQIETSFLENFRDDSEIAKSYQRVEATLRGVGVWDIVLDAPSELTDDYLADVRRLEKRLREIEVDGQRLTKVLSIADVERIAAAVPLLKLASPTARLAGMRAAVPAFSDALLTPADAVDRKLRIMLRSREHLPAETKMALISSVEAAVREETSTPEWHSHFEPASEASPTATSQPSAANVSSSAEAQDPLAGNAHRGQVTGYYVMIARLVSQILGDQWRCLGWAAAMVWVLLVVATRSLRLATLALIPNLLPVLGVLGSLGWIGQEMNMGAAMIAAVSVGLSIDGSVHFLAAYQRKKQRGRSDEHAVLYAQRGVGLPVVLATIALVIGFMGLSRSEFVPTATFGLLTALALFAGTLVNLTVLPALLSLPFRRGAAR